MTEDIPNVSKISVEMYKEKIIKVINSFEIFVLVSWIIKC